MEVKIRALTYEEARAKHFEALKNKAERKMIYWAARSDRSRPHNLADPAHIKAGEFGEEYNFYKDALDALAAAPKWISVKDDTPAHVVAPLLVYAYGHIQKADWSYDKWTEKWWFYVDGEYEPSVTHWMPLPEAPKEDT